MPDPDARQANERRVIERLRGLGRETPPEARPTPTISPAARALLARRPLGHVLKAIDGKAGGVSPRAVALAKARQPPKT